MASEMIERMMYGKYQMVHNPNARGSAPRYKIVNTGEKPKGVTTILGKVLAKDLMGWAVDCCVQELKGKLPVLTQKDLDDAALAYTRKRDAGANTGTEAHAMVEQFLKGSKPSSGSQEAGNAYRAFVEWFEDARPEVLNVEEVIYSEQFKYAGTYDCMLKVDGVNYLCDLKTTNASRMAPNGVYAEYFIQLGAYAYAHEEQRLHQQSNPPVSGEAILPEIEDLMVISAKKNGKMDIVTASDLGLTVAECGEMFKRVLSLYNFLTGLTKTLGGR